MIKQISKRTQRTLCAAACATLAALVAACASTPAAPLEKIAVAKDAVQRAEQAGAPSLAPVELATARDKLARAETAAMNHEIQPATNLAEQADIDAQLAQATAEQQHSHKAAMEFDASMQALRQESMRATAPTAQ